VTTKLHNLPSVLTSFAYRSEYFPELEGLLETVKEHHPDWQVVTGRGPVPGFELPTLEVDSPAGRDRWSLPVGLNLDGTVDDWRKITKMKAWWLTRVWHEFGIAGDRKRLVWMDADSRLNGPLDIELEPETETIAGAWWSDARHPGYESIASGLLLFQGRSLGPVEAILDIWSATCLDHIRKLPEPPIVPWGDGDQEVLNRILKDHPPSAAEWTLLELDSNKYCAIVNKDGTPKPGALVDQWVMARRMKWPDRFDPNWPPPEEARRRRRDGAEPNQSASS